jgi:hypothetical protein
MVGQILQPVAGPLKCPRCNMLFQVAAPQPAPVSAQPMRPAPVRYDVPPQAAEHAPESSGGAAVWLLLGAVVLALAAGGVGLAVYLHSANKAAEEEALRKESERAEPSPAPRVAPVLSTKEKKVNAAIDKGVAYLKDRLLGTDQLYYTFGTAPGHETGANALAGLTLLECGVKATDPAVAKALGAVELELEKMNFTYAQALSILFLDRLDPPRKGKAPSKYQPQIRKLALRLAAGQYEHGGWSYNNPVPKSETELTALELKLRDNNFTPRKLPGKLQEDNSNTQFAALALWVARNHGVPVDPVLVRVGERFRQSQRKDGSWAYHLNEVKHFNHSMTCAGLLGLAVARGISNDKDAEQNKAISRGFEFLKDKVGTTYRLAKESADAHRQWSLDEYAYRKRWTEARGPERPKIIAEYKKEMPERLKQIEGNSANGLLIRADAWGDLYFLWSLQRTATIYDLKKVAGVDWYDWGSEIIVTAQKSDGSWEDRFPGVPDTCFALLFLKRANLVKDLTDKLRQLGATGTTSTTPARKD